MAKVGFKGLSQKHGGGSFRIYDKGDYLVECTKMNYDDGEEKQKAPSFFFQGKIVDGPEQTDGTEVAGMTVSGFFNVDENSEHYEKQLGALNDMCIAFGVAVSKKDDTFNPEAFVGATGTVRLNKYISKSDGEERQGMYGIAPEKSKFKKDE